MEEGNHMHLIDHAARCALVLLAAAACSCFGGFDIECGQDAHCNRFPGGLCHTNPATERRWCTYPDTACPHGHRYSDLDVGDGVSGACTSEPSARCNPTADFGEPTLVPNINSSFDETISMTRDELAVLVYRYDGSSVTLQVSRRTSKESVFPSPSVEPTLTNIVSSPGLEYHLTFTADELIAYFSRQPPEAPPNIYVATRSAFGEWFNEGVLVSVGQSPLPGALYPSISTDGQTLYWLDYYEFKLHSATRRAFGRFDDQMIISPAHVWSHVISDDNLTLYYSDGFSTDVLGVSRLAKNEPFMNGAPVPNINSAQEDAPLFLTPDGCLLYLMSKRPGGIGGFDIWVARRPR
jgi:hypothetical protein